MGKIYIEEKATKSKIFLLPMLELPKGFIIQDLLNVYYGDYNKPELNEQVFLLYNIKEKLDFAEFKTYLSTITEYNSSYSISDNLHMIIFNIPDKYKSDYKEFRNSKYSKVSNKLKRKILGFWDMNTTDDLYKIIYKTEAKRKELSYFLSHTDDGSPVIPIEIREDEEYADRLNDNVEIFNYPTFLNTIFKTLGSGLIPTA